MHSRSKLFVKNTEIIFKLENIIIQNDIKIGFKYLHVEFNVKHILKYSVFNPATKSRRLLLAYFINNSVSSIKF